MASSKRTGGGDKDASKWWNEVNGGAKYGTRGGAKAWTCRYCFAPKKGGTDRVRAHLLGERGHGINACPSIPDAKRQELRAFALSLDAPPTRRPVAAYATPPTAMNAHAPAPPPPTSSTSSARHAPVAGTSSRRENPLPFFQPVSRRTPIPVPPAPSVLRQTTITATWDPRRKAQVDASVARFFYSSYLPFRAARNPYFREMVSEIAAYGPTYVPPTCEQLRTTLLADEKIAINAALEIVRRGWKKNGVTLIGDGWSDNRNRSIHGIVAYSRGNAYFVTSHDTSESGKNAETLAEIWSEAIEYVGAQDVIQFIGDGEAANRRAGAIIEARYPHICFSPCIAHCLSNLLKDISKLPYFAHLIDTAREVVAFVTRHHYILAVFRRVYSGGKTLLKYSETRFAYNFSMLRRLKECEVALRQLVVGNEWLTWSTARSAGGAACRATCTNDSFWDCITHLLGIVDPIIHMLRLVDSLLPCIGKVYEGLDKMVEHIRGLEPDAKRYEDLRGLCQSRWDAYHSPLQAAAYVLDPEFQGLDQEEDGEVSHGWEVTLSRMVPDGAQRRLVRNQLRRYRFAEGIFGSQDAQVDRFRVGAALWWEDYGASTPDLQRLARRILSQGASSSPVEQLWSSFGHIASKRRNRLGTTKTSDLVFVTANLRLLTRLSTEER